MITARCVGGPHHGKRLTHATEVFSIALADHNRRPVSFTQMPAAEVAMEHHVKIGRYVYDHDLKEWHWREPE